MRLGQHCRGSPTTNKEPIEKERIDGTPPLATAVVVPKIQKKHRGGRLIGNDEEAFGVVGFRWRKGPKFFKVLGPRKERWIWEKGRDLG